MSIIERIRSHALADGEFVVIGSGVLDALGLRDAGDIDLVVTPDYFARLKAKGWTADEKHGQEVLTHEDIEAWTEWGSADGLPNFDQLYEGGLAIDGIRFASQEFVRNWKVLRDRPKDRTDVELLNGYLAWKKNA